ncbi:MAG: hypothetical protein MNSN_09920 [Minisyncoccus archaeiphilus]|nr:MAG: hypothetical protein MNSN_09920 [Candidatus Parcubacteria bacterium]
MVLLGVLILKEILGVVNIVNQRGQVVIRNIFY